MPLITFISECTFTEGSLTPTLGILAAKGEGTLVLSKGTKGKEGHSVYIGFGVFKA